METIPYSLYLSNSHRDHPLLILGKIEAFQLVPDVVFKIVFGSFDVMSVWSRSRAVYVVDATTFHAYVFHSYTCLNFAPRSHFLGMGSIQFILWRIEGTIPTLVVVVNGGPTMRTLANLSRFAVSTDAVSIVCFARTQHLLFIGYILLISFYLIGHTIFI